MKHAEHVALLKDGVSTGGVWAEFGSGTGAFTLALRELAGETIEIFSIDKDNASLKAQQYHFEQKFVYTNIHFIATDFTANVPLPPLDGILMANSLHFVKDQLTFLKSAQKYLKPTGKILIVEYNHSVGNQWVPYPVSYEQLCDFAKTINWNSPRLLSTIPSSFMNEIYSAEVLL